jgi:hypothetical protein
MSYCVEIIFVLVPPPFLLSAALVTGVLGGILSGKYFPIIDFD